MSKKWSITPDEVYHANCYAEMIGSELNVKEVRLYIGKDEESRDIEVLYEHNTLTDSQGKQLDIFINNIPQNKPNFAAWLFLESLKEKNNAKV